MNRYHKEGDFSTRCSQGLFAALSVIANISMLS